MYWWKKLLFVSSYKVWFRFQNFVSCSVSYTINWIVTQVGFFPGPKTWSKALTGVGRGITSPFHGDFYFNFHLSWLMCKSWMLQRLEKLICLVRSFSISCDIFWLTYLPEQMEVGKLAFTADPGGLPQFLKKIFGISPCWLSQYPTKCNFYHKTTQQDGYYRENPSNH